jgi:hypothetical protein
MIALVCFVLAILTSPFKSKSRLEAENAAVCTENLIRVDGVMEFAWRNDRAVLFRSGRPGLAI